MPQRLNDLGEEKEKTNGCNLEKRQESNRLLLGSVFHSSGEQKTDSNTTSPMLYVASVLGTPPVQSIIQRVERAKSQSTLDEPELAKYPRELLLLYLEQP